MNALLKLVGDEDIETLRLIEREIHSMVERKARDAAAHSSIGARHESVAKLCAKVAIDPPLLALVGIHPETPLDDDKALIRDAIARRLAD